MPNWQIGSPVFVGGLGKFPGPMDTPREVIKNPPCYLITGRTLDANSAPLGGCAVEIYENVSGQLRGATVSDANGNYSFDVTETASGLTFFAVAYKAGTSDVAGTTVNTLVGTPS